MWRIILVLLALSVGPAAAASGPRAQIGEFAWLAGRWSGTGLGGETEEWIMPAVDGQMVGMFRASRAGKLSFTEQFVFAEADGTVELRVRHFNADFTSWEDKAEMVRFPLVSSGTNRAQFSAVTYERDGDRLRAIVRETDKKGVPVELTLDWVLVK
ncbi:DUF6265 family protein [Roseiterribacter gracilis]|uniref:DUF6265 domain-containing protein n=1 Tax=Roseiterribacter gracilis TaxID=2812848 RepID=A0A8S8X8M6_9PROT|nr:hypothetical protein TMPK1_20400 [Rhodospirillales bacterium TMPK1]